MEKLRLIDQPQVKLTVNQERLSKKNLDDLLFKQGYQAFSHGFPMSKCPPFRWDYMTTQWKRGWFEARHRQRNRLARRR